MTKTTALSKATPKLSLATAADVVRKQLSVIADEVSKELTPPKMVEVYNTLADMMALGNNITELVKGQLKRLVAANGEIATEAGTRRLRVGNWNLEVRPHNSGYDPKKVEALLRAKRVSLDTYMDPEVKYKVSMPKLMIAVEAGVLTNDELVTCRYNESWTFQQPRRADD